MVRMPLVVLDCVALPGVALLRRSHLAVDDPKINTMKFFVFSTLLAAAAAFTTQPVTGPAKIADSPARSRTATIVQSGKANGTFGSRRAYARWFR